MGSDVNVQSEETTQTEELSRAKKFFQRLKKRFEQDESEEDTTEEQAEMAEEQETDAEKQTEATEEPPAPVGRGVLKVSEQSLLYALWREFSPIEANLYEDFYLVLEDPNEEPVPMDTQSLEAEKQRMIVKLLMEAKKRHRLVHPKEEKPKEDAEKAKQEKAKAEKEKAQKAAQLQETAAQDSAQTEQPEQPEQTEATAADAANVPVQGKVIEGAIEVDIEEAPPEVEHSIPDLDADTVFHISKGAMGAWVMLFPPSGKGAELTYDDLMEALEAESIVYGVDKEKIKRIAESPVYFKPILIARGLPPIPGKDGWVEEKYPRELENTFGVDAFGNVDYHSKINMQIVHAEDILCEAFPPTEGIAGMKVTGTELPATDGKKPKLLGGVNTMLNEEQNMLLASMDGNLIYRNDRFTVQPLFQVNGDVDYSVGNIDFTGDVYIRGDVKNGFVVKAKGNIMIDGLVEGSVLEAGGNISIRKGVLGDDRAVIRAQQSVSAQYLENCIVYAGDKVETSSAITSAVYSDNAIIVRAGRGTIIGGELIATNLISATVIGCRSERLTELTIGEFPLLKQQREDLQADLEAVEKEENDTDRSIRYLDREDLIEEAEQARERAAALAKLRLQKSVLGMRKERIRKRMEELEHKEVEVEKCKVLCDTMYPVTKVYFGKALRTIDQMTYRCNIHLNLDDNELELY